MKVILDASEIADQLAECEVGDEKTITFTVTKTGNTIEGTATAAEYAEEGEGEEYEEEEMPEERSHMRKMKEMGKHGKGVPKAILLVAGK